MNEPRVRLSALDTLWFQVGGTVCSMACAHCLVSASPTNHTHEAMTLRQIRPYLDEALRLGVKEYYFTGGEPFINPEMEAIVEATLQQGPVTVLSNGLSLNRKRCERLRRIADGSDHSLDLRISLDGYDARSNDPIRGEGSFERILRAVGNLTEVGLDPVVTVTEVCGEAGTEQGRQRLLRLLAESGMKRPRLKILPLFKIGNEVQRSGAYQDWQRVSEGCAGGGGWDHLQCSSCRMVTDQGVWVCPILVNEPEARMGETLSDALASFSLRFQACWTCHVQGASCRT